MKIPHLTFLSNLFFKDYVKSVVIALWTYLPLLCIYPCYKTLELIVNYNFKKLL